jgi:hypothetical protein
MSGRTIANASAISQSQIASIRWPWTLRLAPFEVRAWRHASRNGREPGLVDVTAESGASGAMVARCSRRPHRRSDVSAPTCGSRQDRPPSDRAAAHPLRTRACTPVKMSAFQIHAAALPHSGSPQRSTQVLRLASESLVRRIEASYSGCPASGSIMFPARFARAALASCQQLLAQSGRRTTSSLRSVRRRTLRDFT